MEKSVNEIISESFSEKEVINLLTELVSIPSHDGIKGQETGVAEYIYNFFVKEDIEAQLIPVIDGRCNVTARLKGTGNGNSLLFTGHTDTVPPMIWKGTHMKLEFQREKCTDAGLLI
ncbi:M20 family metallopeptidase [Aminipila terrae]|uniref:M20/M25/M40 family metallo-hydrolase n=1 Tax=Aminipila terrae TaxID=2697030 RepID=A0A6P1MEA1_9FIRM|nr:M20 family metallopeptidase [Aminipila terrae]QHI72352.1 hypothetical protein Ami3637_07995 [Aminipila terrae]